MGEPTGLSQHMGRQAGGWQGLQDWRGAGATQIESGLEVGAWRREDQSKHDVNPGNMIQCQQKFMTERMRMKDADCHHENFHHTNGGWNGFNMKFAQVLLNLCEGREMLGKSKEQLLDLVHEHCAKAAQGRTETQIVV
eukprot:s386_g10.t1